MHSLITTPPAPPLTLRLLSRLLFPFLLVSISCQTTAVSPTPQPSPIPTSPPTATQLPPTPIPPSPTATPTATNTPPTPTPLPTATPKPTLTLSIPPAWQTAIETAIRQPGPHNQWQWHLLTTDAPQIPLEQGQAHIALVPNATGTLLQQNSTVLAVPFVTEWERTTLAEAQTIIENGHPLVSVMAWSDMPHTHKALRIDGATPADTNYPLQSSWSLSATTGYETAVAHLAAQLPTPEPTIQLAAVGDIMLDRALGYAITQGNPNYPFAQVADSLQAATITIGNVESALGDIGEAAPKSYPFRAPPAAAQTLANAGFDIVSLANNHGMDYGPEALLQAIDLLQNEDVIPIGAGANAQQAYAPALIEHNGLTIAFFGYVNVPVEASSGFDTAIWTATNDSPGLAWATPAQITADVTAVLPQADVIIVMLHSGYEYVEAPSDPQIENAKAAIDAGAHLVIGHHAHILQGVEFYNGGVIVYGLGNFAFEIDGDPNTTILNVWLTPDGVRQLEFLPAVIQFGGQPRLAIPDEANQIRRRIYYLTRLLN